MHEHDDWAAMRWREVEKSRELQREQDRAIAAAQEAERLAAEHAEREAEAARLAAVLDRRRRAREARVR